MGRRGQALVGVGFLAAGALGAYAGSAGADRGVDWLADGAALPAGLCFALAIVFLLRAVLTGRARYWTYLRAPVDDDSRSDDSRAHEPPRSAQTLEIFGDPDQDRRM